MNEAKAKELIETGRNFMKFSHEDEFGDYQSDQVLKKPQPPLTKSAMSNEIIDLDKSFDDLAITKDITSIFRERKSSRVYTMENMTKLQLSYLLWASQGVKDIRGKSYATIRTVPSGGARHGFETYLAIRDIEGIKPGVYQYVALTHQLARIDDLVDWDEKIAPSLVGQTWANKANVVFYWSFVAYRCEWRYGIHAHRPAMIDAGHIGQNLYLACAALNLGTCAIAAFDTKLCNELFQLDGEEEFMVYASPVGTIAIQDSQKEKAFYQFVEDEGL